MAMLAEPRRRQKLSFDPRNKAWSEDSTKYGQKLMEKMGWAKGKGLGVKEDGNVSHVKVSLKNNNLGVGCKASQEDNWIAHQDDFNDLLSSLNEGHMPSTSTDREALSLEERSKKSRSRVHYKKFTRGKDLSKYGEEGMNSILGRRLTNSAPVTPQTQSVENSDDDESIEKNEITHGVITIKSSCSVGEYFAQKMSALKRVKRRQESESHSDTELEAPRCGFGFRESMEQGQRSDNEAAGPSGIVEGGNEDGGNEEEEEQEMESEEGPDGQRNRNKKKKKRKKKKARAAARDSDEENNEQIEVRGESDIEEDEGIDLGRKKKKNKKKKRLVDESKSESASEHNENAEKKKKKKTKKSKKDKNRDSPSCSQEDDDIAENSEERSSGETSKRKRESSEEGLEEDRAETSSGKKKRKKTNREDDVDSGDGPSTSTKKKKKKKQKV